MINYKTCPLKKRPIVFVEPEEHRQQPEFVDYDQPQDLSLKHNAKRVCLSPINLTVNSKLATVKRELNYCCRSESPVSQLSEPSSEYSQAWNLDNSSSHSDSINLSEFNPNHSSRTSQFNSPANHLQSTLIWNPFFNMGFSSNVYDVYNGSHITPPSPPNSACSPSSPAIYEAEDLTIRNDIPLTALLQDFETAPSTNVQPSCTKSLRFKCDKCSKMYSTSIGLSKHKEFHCPAHEYNQRKKDYSCEECGKVYSTVGALKMHIRTHTLPCKCPICGKAFSRPWLLQGHIRTHTGEKPFSCSDCDRRFADRSNLRAHQQTHVDVKKYGCKVCGRSFSRMSLLNKHIDSSCTITIV